MYTMVYIYIYTKYIYIGIINERVMVYKQYIFQYVIYGIELYLSSR